MKIEFDVTVKVEQMDELIQAICGGGLSDDDRNVLQYLERRMFRIARSLVRLDEKTPPAT